MWGLLKDIPSMRRKALDDYADSKVNSLEFNGDSSSSLSYGGGGGGSRGKDSNGERSSSDDLGGLFSQQNDWQNRSYLAFSSYRRRNYAYSFLGSAKSRGSFSYTFIANYNFFKNIILKETSVFFNMGGMPLSYGFHRIFAKFLKTLFFR